MSSGVGPGDHMSCLEGVACSGLLFSFSGVCLLVLSLAASFQLVLYPRPCLSAGGPLILAWGLMGALGNRPSRTRQERRLPVFVRPEDWDCPWCKSEFFRGQVVSTMHLAAEYSSEFRNVKQQEYLQRGKGGRGAGWCEVR